MQLYLKNWRVLNAGLPTLREDQVAELLKIELAGAARARMLERLHQRVSSLRVERERAEILASAKLL